LRIGNSRSKGCERRQKCRGEDGASVQHRFS
jgi:hypothetical protein